MKLLFQTLLVFAALAALAPSGFTWDSCKEAVASSHQGFSDGLNYSIMMMLGVVMTIPVVFGLLIWNSFRVERKRIAESQGE
jgi:heme/copper-type cytochrome/quinol oxidase subunit 2